MKKKTNNIEETAYKYAYFLFLFVFLGITVLTQQESSGQQYRYKIKYGYEYGKGKFGQYSIADTASAYDGSVLIAKARVVKIIEKNPGPNHIEIDETHFNPSGTITYRGKLIFQFGFGGGHIVEEKSVSGIKKYQIFTRWPSGN